MEIMRSTQRVNSARKLVQADAAAMPVVSPEHPDLLITPELAALPGEEKSRTMKDRRWAALAGAAGIAASGFWLASALQPELREPQVESGSEQASARAPVSLEGQLPSQSAPMPAPAPDITHSIQVYEADDPVSVAQSAPPKTAALEAPSVNTVSAAPGAAAIKESERAEGQTDVVLPPPEAPLPRTSPGELDSLDPSRIGDLPANSTRGPQDVSEQAVVRIDEGDFLEPALMARSEFDIGPLSQSMLPAVNLPDALMSDLEFAIAQTRASVSDPPKAPATEMDETRAARPGLKTAPGQEDATLDRRTEVWIVAAAAVRMRREPSLSAPVTALYSTGDEMKVDRREGEWSRVTASDGRAGWMATEYLTVAAPPGADRTPEPGIPKDGSPFAEFFAASFIVDTVAPPAPDLVGFSPESGAPGDGMTNRRELVLNGAAEEGSLITVRGNDAVLGTAPADFSGKWSFATAPLAEGAHSFSATATDPAGNTGLPSAPLEVIVDTTPPSVALSALKSDKTNSLLKFGVPISDPTPTLSGTAEAGSSLNVILRTAGLPDIVLTPVLTGRTWTITPSSPLSDGAYRVTVKATDAAGNVAEVDHELLK
jgi:hypothetical protein